MSNKRHQMNFNALFAFQPFNKVCVTLIIDTNIPQIECGHFFHKKCL